MRLLVLVLLVGCSEIPTGDFPPRAPEDLDPAPDWEVGFTPRNKPAEDVLLEGLRGTPANPAFVGGAVIAGWQEEILADPRVLESVARLTEGATSIEIVVPWYQERSWSSTFERRPQVTPTDASLSTLIDAVHDAGAGVLLTVFVDAANGEWRGTFEPDDPDAWFAAHRALMEHYGALAEEHGVEALSVGSEYTLTEIVHEDAWRGVVAAARGVFSGTVTYGANWDGAGGGGFEGVPWWDAVDAVGVDAWFPLVGEGLAPEVEALSAGWEPWLTRLEDVADATGKPIWFNEIGYASRVGGATRPWEFGGEYEASALTQENAYRAFFERVHDREDWLGAAHFWWWDNASTGDWAGY